MDATKWGSNQWVGQGKYALESEVVNAVTAKWAKGSGGPAGDEHHNLVVGPSPDPRGDRAPDGLAGRVDDRSRVAYRKATKAHSSDDWERWERAGVTDALAAGGMTNAATLVAPTLNANKSGGRRYDADQAESLVIENQRTAHDFSVGDQLLPLGLDSHRYRCCGNGVVAPVAEWIGHRLAAWAQAVAEDAAA
jgi:site-specific DNA-cytosine methylase